MRVGGEKLWRYNAEDCCRTFENHEVLQSIVDKLGLRAPHDFQQSLFHPTLYAMLRGVRVDEAKRKEILDQLQAAEVDAYNWLKEVIGHELNIRSPKQVANFFYREVGQAAYHNRTSGGETTDDEALEKIATREPLLRPVVDKIAELRSIGVFTGTFLRPLADNDGRLRCSFNPAGTVTFRYSSSENAFGGGTNLENWSGGKQKKANRKPPPNVRRIIIPDPGYTFFDIDLSSADLRIVVWESDCRKMKEWFREGKDPYTETAKEYYNDPSITKKDPRRELFKRFGHATNYLGKARNIAPKVGLSIPAAERTQRWYFDKFPEIERWQEKVVATLYSTGTLRNVFGYRRKFLDRIDNTMLGEAAAWIPQSTIAVLINHAWVNLWLNLPPPTVEVLLQNHDSLAGQFLSSVPGLQERILENCQVTLPYEDPLVIPVGLKTSELSWGDC